jgi:hypothetical protein
VALLPNRTVLPGVGLPCPSSKALGQPVAFILPLSWMADSQATPPNEWRVNGHVRSTEADEESCSLHVRRLSGFHFLPTLTAIG